MMKPLRKGKIFVIVLAISVLIVTSAFVINNNLGEQVQEVTTSQTPTTAPSTTTTTIPTEQDSTESTTTQETVENDQQNDNTSLPEQTPPETKPEVNPQPTTPPQANWWDYPSEILPATRSGDDLLVLVNKKYKLPSNYAPSDLVTLTAENTSIRVGGLVARSVIIADLKEMGEAAKAEGIDLGIVSAYRSYQNQESTYNYWVGYLKSQSEADKISARPGHSQHQLGTTLDFTTNQGSGDLLWQAFDNTRAASWLRENAWKFGFVLSYPQGAESMTGYSPESWHYRYIGRDNALEWNNSTSVFEIWLRDKNH